MDRRRDRRGVAFYAGLIVLLAAIMLGWLPMVAPDPIAGRIARNSEGVALLLVLAVWIQFVRPRLAKSAARWRITMLVAASLLVIGVTLFVTEPVNAVKTLNETFLAAAILVPYLELPRPLPAWLPLTTALGLILLVVVGQSGEVITLTAEALGALILVPVGLDAVDRGILDPTVRTVGWLRAGWYAFLIAGPAIFWATDNGAATGGTTGAILTYAGRTTEIFLCLLALQLYFAVGLARTGVDEPGGARASAGITARVAVAEPSGDDTSRRPLGR